MKTVYLVCADCGEYDTAYTRHIAAYLDRAKAYNHATQATTCTENIEEKLRMMWHEHQKWRAAKIKTRVKEHPCVEEDEYDKDWQHSASLRERSEKLVSSNEWDPQLLLNYGENLECTKYRVAQVALLDPD